MNAGTIIALVTAIVGVGGLIFTALKFNREQSAATVTQASQILDGMKALNDGLRAQVGDLRIEVERLQQRVEELTAQLAAANEQLRAMLRDGP